MAERGNRHAASKVVTDEVGPWMRWRTSSLPARAKRFIETYCIAAKGHHPGKPLRLGAWQMDWLEQVLCEGVESSALTLPRGQGKSTFCGAVGTWALFDEQVADVFGGKPDIPVVAVTLKQARKGVYGAARDFRRLHPDLADRSIEYTAMGDQRIHVPRTDGELYPVAADVDALQGLDPLIALVDEIGFIGVDAWDALLLSAGKRPRNLILALGTRNPEDTPNALDHLLAQVELHGGIDGFVIVDYSADPDTDIDDRAQWLKANPAIGDGYLRMSALENARKLSPAPAFQTFRLNLKTGSQTGWLGKLGPQHWDETEVDRIEFDPSLRLDVGVDKSAYGDCSAVVARQVQGDRLAVMAWIFVPDGGVIDHAAVRHRLRELHAVHAPVIGYDDRYFVEGAAELEAEGLTMVKVPQTPQRLVPAFSNLYAAIVEHRLAHVHDPGFRAHVLGAVPQLDRSGGFMLAKGRSKTKIDAAVAMGIAEAVSTVEIETAPEYGPTAFKVF